MTRIHIPDQVQRDRSIPRSYKAILANILGHVNHEGHPLSRRTIAEEECCSVRTVTRAVRFFLDNGLLTATPRFDPRGGWQLSNHYQPGPALLAATPWTVCPPPLDSLSTPGGHGCPAPLDMGVQPLEEELVEVEKSKDKNKDKDLQQVEQSSYVANARGARRGRPIGRSVTDLLSGPTPLARPDSTGAESVEPSTTRRPPLPTQPPNPIA